MDCLRTRTQQLLDASIAVNTASTYKNAVSCFDKFCLQYGLTTSWPAKAEKIIMFISYCFETGYSPSTISTYISGLSYFHKLHNWYDPSELFVIKKLLEGCHRSRKRVDNRAPITPLMLRAICLSVPIMCYNDYEAALFNAAYLLAYFGLLRVSELVFTTHQHSGRALQFSDITFNDNNTAVTISIRQSKTNQAGPPTVLRIPCESDPAVCPVCSLSAFCAIRPKGHGCLFQHQNGSPLTRSQFSGVLTKCISSHGQSGKRILTHSFRIGRATDLASQGVAHDAIMKMGRWRSSAYQAYIRP